MPGPKNKEQIRKANQERLDSLAQGLKDNRYNPYGLEGKKKKSQKIKEFFYEGVHLPGQLVDWVKSNHKKAYNAFLLGQSSYKKMSKYQRFRFSVKNPIARLKAGQVWKKNREENLSNNLSRLSQVRLEDHTQEKKFQKASKEQMTGDIKNQILAHGIAMERKRAIADGTSLESEKLASRDNIKLKKVSLSQKELDEKAEMEEYRLSGYEDFDKFIEDKNMALAMGFSSLKEYRMANASSDLNESIVGEEKEPTDLEFLSEDIIQIHNDANEVEEELPSATKENVHSGVSAASIATLVPPVITDNLATADNFINNNLAGGNKVSNMAGAVGNTTINIVTGVGNVVSGALSTVDSIMSANADVKKAEELEEIGDDKGATQKELSAVSNSATAGRYMAGAISSGAQMATKLGSASVVAAELGTGVPIIGGAFQAASGITDVVAGSIKKKEAKEVKNNVLEEDLNSNYEMQKIADQAYMQTGTADIEANGKIAKGSFNTVAGALNTNAVTSAIGGGLTVGAIIAETVANSVANSSHEKNADLVVNQETDLDSKINKEIAKKYEGKKEVWKEKTYIQQKKEAKKIEKIQLMSYDMKSRDEMALNITKERAAELARNVNDPDSPGYEDALKMVNMLKATPDANGYYHPETIERLLYSRDEKNVQDQMLPILREKKAKLEEEKDNSLLYHAQKNKSKTVNVSKTELKYGNKKEDVGLSIRKIEPLMEKGSKEATELRDLLATYLEAVNARQQVSFEKKQKLFETAANYLHLKSGVPSTKYGQDRVNAAGEVMLKIGRNLLQTATPEQAEKIRKEISMQCYRNPQYKKQAVKAAKADLNNAIKNNISIKDDPNLRYSLSLALMDEYTELTFGTKEGHYNQKVDNPKDLAYLENIMQFGDEISQGFLDKVLTQKDPNKDIEKFLKSLEPAKKLEAPSIEIKVPSLEKDLL